MKYHRTIRDNDTYVVYAVVPPQAARNPEFYHKQNIPVPTLRVVKEDDSGVGELTVDDYFVGLRVTPWKILIEPYGSAGVTWVDSGLDTGATDDGDEVLAYYLRVGAAFTIGIIRLGLDGRALFGSDVDLDTIESDVDGYQLAAFVGLGF